MMVSLPFELEFRALLPSISGIGNECQGVSTFAIVALLIAGAY
jgi:hypothetical protein